MNNQISLDGVFTPNTVSQQEEEIASLQAPHELHLRSKVTNFWNFRVAELPLLVALENTGFTNPDSWSNVAHTRIRTKFAPSGAGLRLNVKQNGNEKNYWHGGASGERSVVIGVLATRCFYKYTSDLKNSV